MTDSQQLLAEYARNGSDAAFGELVTRYVDLVYSTALRLVEGDTHRAEDVAQTVFVDLARVARTLPKDVSLGGWLHRDTCFVAGHAMRGERRRQSRERQAVEMNALQDNSEADFSRVAPVLDEAINELGEADRTAILLRFFEQQDFRSVGRALGSNEDAARMRVRRALEKLESLLKRRGVTASSVTLAVVLGANAMQAAPVGLAATIATAAALAVTTIATTATATAVKTIAMTTLQKAIITAALVAAVGTGVYEAPPTATPASSTLGCPSCSPDTVLALARHAARLDRAPKCHPEFPIRVHSERVGRATGLPYFQPDEFDHCPVERFLDEGPFRAVLIGLPGAGKSYSLQQAAARLAEKLHESCLSDTFDETKIVVPLLADLKLYHGDLDDLINRTLPHGLSLSDLSHRCKVKIYLDSFNEMPREYWESGSYEADFAKVIADNANASFIIGSRTSDGLSKVGFPFYRLDQIDEAFVTAELERLKIDVGGRFQREVRWLLQKPFYFQLVASRTVSLPEQPHPRDIYQTFFRGLAGSFQERFGQAFNLEHALSLAAYEAINRGEEAQSLADVLQILKTELEGSGLVGILAPDVANWLVSKSVVIPYRGARIALFHQSATEYLAASELARRYQRSPHILKEKLSLTRWDQALFLTLSLLAPSDGASFLKAVIDADLDRKSG